MSFTSAFASISAIVPSGGYAPKPLQGSAQSVNSNPTSGNNKAIPVQIGLAQSLTISDNFGVRPVNTLGTPFPVFQPGYMQTTISIEKATVDGYAFSNLGAFNPLWAAVGSTYRAENAISLKGIDSELTSEDGSTNSQMFPFMFVLSVKDKISDSSRYGHRIKIENTNPNNAPEDVLGVTSKAFGGGNLQNDVKLNKEKAVANPFGMYVCVVSSSRIGLQASNHVIVNSIECFARPIYGTWFSDAIAKAFREENGNNGMHTLVNDVMYGYKA